MTDDDKDNVEMVMAVLDLHRWKTFKDKTLECECGTVMTVATRVDEYYHSELDTLFRRHIAEAAVEALNG